MSIASLAPALPEIFLALAAMALLLVGAFIGNSATRLISWAAVLALFITFILVLKGSGNVVAFNGMYVADAFSRFAKGLVLIGSALSILVSLTYLRHERIERFEYPVLILLATVGMLMMTSANDLLSLYVSMELQSLALYVVAAFNRDSSRSSEAGLKYFVLGALSSGMLLYGCSLIYGFTGTTSFVRLAGLFANGSEISLGLIVGIVFLTAGLAFKVAAAPFHMWTPDVYEGAPTPVTAFFAVAPKIAAIALFLRAMLAPFGDLSDEWRQIIVLLSVASMVLGSFAAIGQSNIKRLMAYSSISNIGYALIGLAAGTAQGVRGVLIYMAIYLAMTLGGFTIILCMRRQGKMVEDIRDLSGLARTHPMLAVAMAVFMFSQAGVPPLAGFFGKFYIFMAAINAGLYTLAVIGVLTSVVGAYYYLNIVKLMWFDAAAEPFERQMGAELGIVMAVTTLFTLLFVVDPAPLLAGAQTAALALFP